MSINDHGKIYDEVSMLGHVIVKTACSESFEFCNTNLSTHHLHSSTRDEEPLVDAAIDGSGEQVLATGDSSELGLVSGASRLLDLDVVTE